MQPENVKLIEPRETLLDALAGFLAEYGDDFRNVDGLGWAPDVPLEQMVERFHENARGINLPDGFVPSSVYWLVRGETTILGMLCLRHGLNERLRQHGGHIGYSVRPSERGKGYATRMLALALDKARQRGLERVLLTCNKTNRASARVIEKNGGVLEGERPIMLRGEPRMSCYYWIEL
jgi:predicted acetyltransferase